MTLEEIGIRAREVEPVIRVLPTAVKNRVLHKAAENLRMHTEEILRANGECLRDCWTASSLRMRGWTEWPPAWKPWRIWRIRWAR